MIFGGRFLGREAMGRTKAGGLVAAAALVLFGLAAGCGVEDLPGDMPTRSSAAALKVNDHFKDVPVIHLTKNLVLEGYMRYGERAAPNVDLFYVYVNVLNVGNVDVAAGRILVGVDGEAFLGSTQKEYIFNRDKLDYTIPADPKNNGGVIVFTAPKARFTSCHTYAAQVDVDHSVQAGPGVFDNDIGQAKTPCSLSYDAAIVEGNLGYPPPTELTNNTIYNVVSSFSTGRPDGKLCSHCHFNNSTVCLPDAPSVCVRNYRPTLFHQDDSMAIGPNQVVVFDPAFDTVVWKSQGGWATRMVNANPKAHSPAAIDLVRKWINDGWM